MAKTTTVKLTKTFKQGTLEVYDLASYLQTITNDGGTVLSILQRAEPNTYEVVYVVTTREEVEVDVPDEVEALEQPEVTTN